MRVSEFRLTARGGPDDSASLDQAVSERPDHGRIRAAGFPARVSMRVQCQIEFEPHEVDQRYQIRLVIVDSADQQVAHFGHVANPQSDATEAAARVRVTFVQLVESLVIAQPGTYTLHIIVDGTRLSSYSLRAQLNEAA